MNLNKKTMLAVMLVALTILVAPSLAQAQTDSVGVVNLQMVLDQHPQLPEAQAKYQEAVAELQKELEGLDEEQQQEMLPQLQQAVQQLEREIQQELLEDILATIKEVAAELNLSTILDENAVLIGGQNITEEVIAALK